MMKPLLAICAVLLLCSTVNAQCANCIQGFSVSSYSLPPIQSYYNAGYQMASTPVAWPVVEMPVVRRSVTRYADPVYVAPRYSVRSYSLPPMRSYYGGSYGTYGGGSCANGMCR